ncbi:glycosyltransferase family 2 protein [Enterococcus villorum]|uniref:Glycosyltransferase 2-like domain-containing protein n=1 Tax=Enterococcus villorum TaxID=112904 RepID=A0A511J2M0_9ENTE|nr:glycosyltransferase family 2 protein [Enterococcus villorum]GEL92251.1 hypothetical protein EVI01_15880 [Enterococcus villorum]
MEKISVIVPIYNGAAYLENTIQSLLNQPYKNIELILVDDGSQDNSYQICQKFYEQDDRVLLIHQENGGICAARNTGLTYATGEFVSFIDQDDQIDDKIYVHLVNRIGQADLVVGSKKMQLINKKHMVLSNVNYIYDEKLLSNQKEITYALFNLDHQMTFFHLWNCLYRKKIIDDYQLTFDERFRYGQEDTLFNFNYVSRCQSIQLIPEIVYMYNQRELTSTSLKNNPLAIEDFIRFIDTIRHLEWEEEAYFYYKKYSYTYFLRHGLNVYTQFGMKTNHQKEMLQAIHQVLSKDPQQKARIMESSSFYRHYFYLTSVLMKKQRYRTLNQLIYGTAFVKKVLNRVTS